MRELQENVAAGLAESTYGWRPNVQGQLMVEMVQAALREVDLSPGAGIGVQGRLGPPGKRTGPLSLQQPHRGECPASPFLAGPRFAPHQSLSYEFKHLSRSF